MTPRSLVLMKAFWFYSRFCETMSFFKFAASVSKVTNDVPKISIVWLARVKCLLLLWKRTTAWIKRSIDYVILQCYNPGDATQRNSSLPQSWLIDFWYKRSKFWKWHCLKKWLYRIKTPSSKSLILVSFC